MSLKKKIIGYMGVNYIPVSDKLYLKIKFKDLMGKRLNLKNPRTFNEKMQWLKLYDRNPMYTALVDKYEVRSYIEEKMGKKYLIPLLGVYDKFDDIDFEKLPNQFVIKCTHDSGGVVVCKDKKMLNIDFAREKINYSLKTNYFYSCREWPYKNVKPRIIIEKYMKDSKSDELIDYKVMCFNGKPSIIFTCTERFTESGLKVTFFDINWNKLPFERHYPNSKKSIDKPKNLDKMLQFSKKLSTNIPFVRVDFYEINDELFFGELTFYPGSGFEEFTPSKWDYKLGDMLDISGIRKR